MSSLLSLHPSTLLSIAFLLFTTGLALLHILAQFYARYKLHKPIVKLSEYVGVSILKPLVGVEPNLENNLRTFFHINYPKYELLFCVHDDEDPSVPLVRKLMEEFPNVDAQLFIGGEEVGLNPKVNNMMPAYRNSKHPLILISDSVIRMRPEALTDMVGWMTDKVALVTQMPFCYDRDEWGPSLEQIYFGTSHARIYLVGNLLNFVCSTGMSSMIRKKALEECGGMGKFGDFLAEDYFFGVELTKRGWECGLAALPALQNSGSVTSESFDARASRWTKLRFAMLPHIIVVEPLQDCFVNCLLFSLSVWNLTGWNPFIVMAIHLITWFSSDYSLFNNVHGKHMRMDLRRFFVLWLRREFFAPRIYVDAMLKPDICWRKGTYRLAWGGRIKTHPMKNE
ncbi:hypothetical protein PFISCL1PPCAC_6053 [Pristionchus fissidentatus]|uniref:ceramide glucosyltransferase n=1 Tax=Pristionchus fissidentatus TaxID=1538716 RepID=A0AAV5V5W7_9BILA|nr:hypothetical protein PFISCL1PPCAC_6053 [Pristionchus fissidentatus]